MSSRLKSFPEKSKHEIPYSAPAEDHYKEVVSLPGDDSGTLYRVSKIDGVVTALNYNGSIVKDKEQARKVLEASVDQGSEGGKIFNPYKKENTEESIPHNTTETRTTSPFKRPKPAKKTENKQEEKFNYPFRPAGSKNGYSTPVDTQYYKEVVSLPGDNSGTEYKVTNINGIPTATYHSGKIIEDYDLSRQVLSASNKAAQKENNR